MNDLENLAIMERKTREDEIHGLIGGLMLRFPNNIRDFLKKAAELHDLVDKYERDFGKTKVTKNLGDQFLFLLKYKNYQAEKAEAEEQDK